jgi:hypothetical protein
MCNPSRVFHSDCDKFTLLDDWSVEFGSRGESDDDDSMESVWLRNSPYVRAKGIISMWK